MNLTPEIRKRAKTIGAAAALVIAVIFCYSALSGGPSPAGTTTGSPQSTPEDGKLVDPTLKLALLKDSPYKGNGRNIFRMGEEPMPTPVAGARVGANGQLLAGGPTPIPPPPTPIPPPPINLKFYGYANKPGQPKKVFLLEGEDIFVGIEGDIVDRHYKILHIGATSVDVEDLLNNNRQTLPLQT
jgi:hypothetical protein